MPASLTALLLTLPLPTTPADIIHTFGAPDRMGTHYIQILESTAYDTTLEYGHQIVILKGPTTTVVTHVNIFKNGQPVASKTAPLTDPLSLSNAAPAYYQPPQQQGQLTILTASINNVDLRWIKTFHTLYPNARIAFQFTEDRPENRAALCQGLFSPNHQTTVPPTPTTAEQRLCETRSLDTTEINLMLRQAAAKHYVSGTMYIAGTGITTKTPASVIESLLNVRKGR